MWVCYNYHRYIYMHTHTFSVLLSTTTVIPSHYTVWIGSSHNTGLYVYTHKQTNGHTYYMWG